MKKFITRIGLGLAAVAGFANAALTPPTPDYADLYTIGTLVLGVVIVVYLIRKAIGFFR